MKTIANRTVSAAILFAIFAIGILLRTAFLNVPAERIGPDESFYVKYASYMAQDKGASIKALFDTYLTNTNWQMYPDPLRFGYIRLSALWMKMIGRFDFQALCYLSAFFSVLSLFMGYLFTKRLFGAKAAMLSLMLLAVSPLNLAMARRALQDSVVYFFIIAAVYVFYLAVTKRRLFITLLFGVALFTAVSMKETLFILAGFFAFFALWDRTFFRKDLNLAIMFAVLFIALGAVVLVYIKNAGGLEPVVRMVKILLSSPLTNEYAVRYQSGNLFRYLVDFFLISPATLIAAVCFCAWHFTRHGGQDEAATYLILFLIISYLMFSFFSKNLRYVMALDLPIRICAALFILDIFSRFKERGTAISFAVIAVISIADIFMFNHMFLVRGIYDPVTAGLLSCWR